jgi:hypothetical protein
VQCVGTLARGPRRRAPQRLPPRVEIVGSAPPAAAAAGGGTAAAAARVAVAARR